VNMKQKCFYFIMFIFTLIFDLNFIYLISFA